MGKSVEIFIPDTWLSVDVGEDVELKRIGNNKYIAMCPFCLDDSSFFINDDRGIFTCSNCRKGGNILAYYMGYGHTFSEALSLVQRKYM